MVKEDIRCACGKLLMQIEDKKVYVKCRGCKRIIVVSFEEQDLIDGQPKVYIEEEQIKIS